MKTSIIRAAGISAIAFSVAWLSGGTASGQVTVTTTQTSAPAVVGYAARPAGLFGLRTAYDPVVANVPVKKTVTTVQQQRPVYVAPPVTVQRTVVPPPTYVAPTYVPAPVAVPVTTYLAPAPPTPLPVTTYYTPVYPRY